MSILHLNGRGAGQAIKGKKSKRKENLHGTLREKSQRSTKLILKGAEKQISIQGGYRNRKYTLNVIK